MKVRYLVVIVLFKVILFVTSKQQKYVPIVLWHGMGDACCYPYSLGPFQDHLNESLPGVHMLSIKMGKTIVDDVENSFFMHPNKQIAKACEAIQADPQLANGYNGIGFSQGSQFIRALAQRCSKPKMKNLITLGGQHQGVYGLPNCITLSHPSCDYVRKLLNMGAYLGWVQKMLVQATYWHDPIHDEEYKAKSTFLADINNEVTINQTYVDNLRDLYNFVMIRFEADTMVQPVESEWFGFYKPGQSKDVETLQESELYKTDRLGLKQLDNEGKLHFLSLPGNHLQFDWKWFNSEIVNKYLN